jgi:ribosomal protein L39E
MGFFVTLLFIVVLLVMFVSQAIERELDDTILTVGILTFVCLLATFMYIAGVVAVLCIIGTSIASCVVWKSVGTPGFKKTGWHPFTGLLVCSACTIISALCLTVKLPMLTAVALSLYVFGAIYASGEFRLFYLLNYFLEAGDDEATKEKAKKIRLARQNRTSFIPRYVTVHTYMQNGEVKYGEFTEFCPTDEYFEGTIKDYLDKYPLEVYTSLPPAGITYYTQDLLERYAPPYSVCHYTMLKKATERKNTDW